MTNDEIKKYICVDCGSHVKSLYKQYSKSVLKLCNCERCGKVADKYLEYDKVIIFIDLILFSREAYRHVLYNVQYKGYIKLAVLQLIVVLVNECIYSQSTIPINEHESFNEATYFLVFLATILGKILFLLIICFFINICNVCSSGKMLTKNSLSSVLKAIVCSSFGYFLLLTILIWDDFQREIHLIFIYTYTTLSQIQALTVTTEVPKPLLGAICTFSVVLDHFVSNLLKWSFGVYHER